MEEAGREGKARLQVIFCEENDPSETDLFD
jgi:hypothetical protein